MYNVFDVFSEAFICLRSENMNVPGLDVHWQCQLMLQLYKRMYSLSVWIVHGWTIGDLCAVLVTLP